MLCREVMPPQDRLRDRLVIAAISLALWAGCLCAFSIVTGCGRGGQPTCVPQPAIGSGPARGAGPCEVRQ